MNPTKINEKTKHRNMKNNDTFTLNDLIYYVIDKLYHLISLGFGH